MPSNLIAVIQIATTQPIRLGDEVPIERLRGKVLEIVKAPPHSDGDVASLLVSDAKETSLEVKVLPSARSSGALKDLHCEIRENVGIPATGIFACLPRRVPARAASRPATPAEIDVRARRQALIAR
jgi:hypothetical protein